MKKIAVLNDLSGLGKCSLTAAIPVISVMGVQACPLPTAVLSAQTGFPSYYYDDYTAHMEEIMDQWEKMDFRPNGIYTGFLAGDDQAEMALEFIERFADADTRILTDPILGDNGMEYPIYTEALCEKMRQLAEKASMITPNLTEALLLLYGKEEMHCRWKYLSGLETEAFMVEIRKTGQKIAENFHTEAVITGIDLYTKSADKEAEMANLIVNESNWEWVTAKKEGGSYSGTGDLFASVLSAGMVKGMDTAETVKKAVRFISGAIHDTVLEGTDRNEGVCFEKHLGELL